MENKLDKIIETVKANTYNKELADQYIRDLLDQEVHIGYSHIKIENKLSDLKFVKNMNEILKKLLDLKSRLIKAF